MASCLPWNVPPGAFNAACGPLLFTCVERGGDGSGAGKHIHVNAALFGHIQHLRGTGLTKFTEHGGSPMECHGVGGNRSSSCPHSHIWAPSAGCTTDDLVSHPWSVASDFCFLLCTHHSWLELG